MQNHRAGCRPSSVGKFANDSATLSRPPRETPKTFVHRDASRLDRCDELAANMFELGRVARIAIAGEQPGQLVKRRLVLWFGR